ncbi:ABC transporter permease [Paenibacillus chitinolyticus]|nr:ABC transporter permease [Paenibacillus chitinolyticus]MCY9593451.1 ABC transporter permease [Paenibacillus chitinolyticus]MCY9596212.1 ABC transporter permease [Paenibacillus chitinolyticus]
MTPAKLFKRRLLDDWTYQYRILRTAVDWTVAVYLIVPALIFASIYYSAWLRTPPEWFGYIPASLVAVFLYLFAWSGTVRFFIEEADQLFLVRSEGWMPAIKRRGLLYSLALQALTTALLAGALLPLLRAEGSGGALKLAALFLAVYAAKVNLGLLRQLAALAWAGWKRVAVSIALFAAGFLIYWACVQLILADTAAGYLAGPLLLAAAVPLGRRRLRAAGAFHADVQREREARLKLASLMLRGIVEGKKPRQRRVPLLLGRSQRVVRGTGASAVLADSLVKSVLRRPGQWKLYAQLTAVLAFAAWRLPGPMHVVLWAVAAFVLAYWMKSVARETLGASFFRMFAWSEINKQEALRKASFALAVPGLALIGLIAGGSISLPLGIAALVLSVPAAYAAAFLVTIWY